MVTIGSAEYQITVDSAGFKRGLSTAERDAAASAGRISASLSGVSGAVGQALGGTAGAVKGALAGVSGAASGSLGGLAGTIQTALGGIPGAVTSALGGVPATVSSALGGVASAVTASLGSIPQAVTASLGGVGASVTSALGSIPSAVGGALGGVTSAVTSALSGVPAAISSALSGATAAISSALSGATQAATGALSGVAGAVSSSLGGITGSISSALSGVGGAFESAFSGVDGTVSAALGNLASTVGSALSGLSGAIGSALSGAASGAASAFQGASSGITSALGAIGTAAAAAGAAIAIGLGLGVKMAGDLEQAVANISTIKPEIDTKDVFKQLSELSTRVPQSAAQLGEALYNIFSSLDINVADSLTLLEKLSKGAVGARTDAETFATAVIGVMNAYKLSVADADKITDVFFNTVNRGVVSGEQLATGLGPVTAAAKALGVTFEEVGALIVGVTKEGGLPAQNLNNLANTLQKFSDPQTLKGFRDLGIQVTDIQGKFRPLTDVFTDLQQKLAGLSQSAQASALQGIFPDVQARQGAQTIISQLDTVNAALAENRAATGSTASAYEKMVATFNSQSKLLLNDLLSIATTIGGNLLPSITPVVSAFARDLPGAFAATQAALAPLGAAIADTFSKLSDAGKGGGFEGLTGALRQMVEGIDLDALFKPLFDAFAGLPERINAAIKQADPVAIAASIANLLATAFTLAFKAAQVTSSVAAGIADAIIAIDLTAPSRLLGLVFLALLNRAWAAAFNGFRPNLPEIRFGPNGPQFVASGGETPNRTPAPSRTPANAEDVAGGLTALAQAERDKAAVVAGGQAAQTEAVKQGTADRAAIIQDAGKTEKEQAEETIHGQIKLYQDEAKAFADAQRDKIKDVQDAAQERRTAIEEGREADIAAVRDAAEADTRAIDARKQASADYYEGLIRAVAHQRDLDLQAVSDRKDAALRGIEEEKRALEQARTREDRTTASTRETEARNIEASFAREQRGLDEEQRGIERVKDAALRGIDERIDAEDRRHTEALRNLDEEEQRQLGIIDDRLKKLDAQQQKEQRKETDRSLGQGLSDAKSQLSQAKTPAERARAERAVADAERAISRERSQRRRDDARAELHDQADAIRKKFAQAKQAETDQSKANKDGLAKEKQVITDRAARDKEALDAKIERFKEEQKQELQAVKDRYTEEDRITADRRQKEDDDLTDRKTKIDDTAKHEADAIRTVAEARTQALRDEATATDRAYGVEKQKVTDRANHDIAEIRRVATFRLNQLAADTRATIRELNAQITVHQTAADKMVDIWKRALTNIKGFVRAEVKVTYFQAPSGSNAPESGAGLANDKEGRTTAGSAPTSSGPASFGQVADALRSGAPTRLASDGSVEVFLNGQWRTTGQRPGDAIPGGGTVPTPRAGGGPVKARDLYLVGERGRPELFVPDQDGHIIDDVKTAALLGGSAGRGFDIPEPTLLSAGYAAGAQRGWDGAASGATISRTSAPVFNITNHVDARGVPGGEQVADLVVAKTALRVMQMLDETERNHAEAVPDTLGGAW